MELNARPGLSIQIANNTGLSPRIRRIARESKLVSRSVEERVAYSMREFCSEPSASAAV